MTLNEFAAGLKREIFAELEAGHEPSRGRFDPNHLAECRTKSAPQIGKTRYEPHTITLEFLYPDSAGGAAAIFTVEVDSPERIVYLPVPSWVVENIWQGDISGTFHFESEAMRLMEDLRRQLDPDQNQPLFGPQAPKRRE